VGVELENGPTPALRATPPRRGFRRGLQLLTGPKTKTQNAQRELCYTPNLC